MPNIEHCQDIVKAFKMAGFVQSNGVGASPLSWLEISTMNDSALLELGPWELKQVRFMSEAYSSQHSKSNNKELPPPYIENEEEYVAYTKKAFLEKQMEARRIAIANQK